MIATALAFAALTPTAITLTRSPNPSTLGQAVTLTATVTAAGNVTGRVTFYDGVTVLGAATISGGRATLMTRLLPSGNRALKAYYSGDASLTPSSSATVAQAVVALPQIGFRPAAVYNVGNFPFGVAVMDLNGDGQADLAAANGLTNTVSIVLGKGEGTFEAAAVFNAGANPVAVAAGDFNGDGRADLVAANVNGGNVSVLLGNGDGSFRAAVMYPVGSSPRSITVADFNGDGKADLAVANTGSNDVSVLLGNGDGTFQPAVSYNAGSAAYSVAAGDFNGDGKADLAVANAGSDNVSVLLGNGDGTFQAAVNFSAGTSPDSVAVGDFNGDGKADLAVANYNSNNVSVLLGNGDGTFQTATHFNAGTNAASVVVGDFNGDGKADLAVANFNSANVSVLLGNGNGTFQSAANYSVGGTPISIAAGDLNGDGVSDLVVTNNSNAAILLGVPGTPDLSIRKTHAGNFARGQTGAVYTITVSNAGGVATSGAVSVTDIMPAGLTATDISGVGWTCLLEVLICARGDRLAAFASFPAITITVNVASNAPASVTNVALVSSTGDLNTANDTASDPTAVSAPDLTITKTHSGNFSRGQTGAVFNIRVFNAGGAPTEGGVTVRDTMLPADLTASAIGGAGWTCSLESLTCVRNDPVAPLASYPPITLTVNVAVSAPSILTNRATVLGGGELNLSNNTASDPITIAGSQTATLALACSPNPSTLAQAVTLRASLPALAIGKVTFYDGVTVLGTSVVSAGQAMLTTRLLPAGIRSLKAYYSGDAIFAAGTSAPLTLVVNAAAENGLQAAGGYSTGTGPISIAVGDFNGDGKADLATANFGGDTVSVLLGNGDGTFQSAVNYRAGSFPSYVVVADFNQDGKADLAVINAGSNNVSVLLGNGDGTFQPAVNYNTGSLPISEAVGDFNGDGKADLAVANFTSDNVSVLLGNGDGTFQPASNYVTGRLPHSVAVGDFNGDGKADLAVANDIEYLTGPIGGNNVSILLGNGDGTFQDQVAYKAGSAVHYVAVEDFNGDGKPDLAVANQDSADVSVLLGKGDGTFHAPSQYSTGSTCRAVLVGDLNGDGKLDLIGVNAGSNNVSVLLGNGDGTFQAAVNYFTGMAPFSVAVGDFNGDGLSDLAVPNGDGNNVRMLLGVGIPDLSIAKTHAGNFTQGQIGASYSITVSNGGRGQTVGAVTVADTLPAGLTATAMSGTGWSCTLATLTCTRSDTLGPSASYPVITLTVNVGLRTAASVTNTVSVSGGGGRNAANRTASDLTTILPAVPQIFPGGVVNGASFSRNSPIALGAIASLFGTQLATDPASATSLPLATVLGDTQVLVNGTPAPLFYVAPAQINFQMPLNLAGSTAAVRAVLGSTTGLETTVNIAAAAPGIFTIDSSGSGRGAVLNEDLTLNSPDRPAAPGSLIVIYATGLGVVDPPLAAGQPGSKTEPYNRTVNTPVVTIGGQAGKVDFSGVAPGFAGLYQINVRIPETVSPGSVVPLKIRAGTSDSNEVTITVR